LNQIEKIIGRIRSRFPALRGVCGQRASGQRDEEQQTEENGGCAFLHGYDHTFRAAEGTKRYETGMPRRF
jgi:hypothetical protein